MKKSVLYVLIALMLVIGAAAVACGGGDDNDNGGSQGVEQQDNQDSEENGDSQDSDEAGDEDAQDEEDADAQDEDSGGSGGSLGDVPIYPGAKEITSGEWSGSEGGIPGIGSGVDTADYENIEFAMYETDDSPEDVFDWYKDKMSDWDEEGSFSGGSGSDYGAYALWTKDGGKTGAWITVGESDGTTSLGVWVASQ